MYQFSYYDDLLVNNVKFNTALTLLLKVKTCLNILIESGISLIVIKCNYCQIDAKRPHQMATVVKYR